MTRRQYNRAAVVSYPVMGMKIVLLPNSAPSQSRARATLWHLLLLLVVFCAAERGIAQKSNIAFWELPADHVSSMVLDAPAGNDARYARLRDYFTGFHCNRDLMEAQPVRKREPNLICVLPGEGANADQEPIYVTARYDRRETASGVSNGWGGAVMLPILYQAMQAQPRAHTLVFIALEGETGVNQFAESLRSGPRPLPSAIIALHAFGLGAPRYYAPAFYNEHFHDPHFQDKTPGSSMKRKQAWAEKTGVLVSQAMLTARLQATPGLRPNDLSPAVTDNALLSLATNVPTLLLYSDYSARISPEAFHQDFEFTAYLLCSIDTLLGQGPAPTADIRDLGKLAAAKKQHGDPAGAEALYRQALAKYDGIADNAIPAADRVEVATDLNNLGILLAVKGSGTEAEPEYRRALAISELAGIDGQSGNASILNNLALLLEARGDYAQAEPLFRRALAIREKILAPEDPDTAVTRNSLGGLLQVKGKLAEAEALFRQALAVQEKTPGTRELANTLENLAGVIADRGSPSGAPGNTAGAETAETLYRRALAIDRQALGPDDPEVAHCLSNLSALLLETGDIAEAETLLRQALAIDEKALGPNDPAVSSALVNLGAVLKDRGADAEAEPMLRRALAIDEKASGPARNQVGIALDTLAAVLAGEHKQKEAGQLYRQALDFDEKLHGPNDPSVALHLNHLGSFLLDLGDDQQAEPLLQRALAIDQQALGPDHPRVASDLEQLARLQLKRRDEEGARISAARALVIDEKTWGGADPRTKAARRRLGELGALP